MSWNYRITRKSTPNGPYFAIHEVYYDKEDRAYAITENPSYPSGETPEGLREDLMMMKMDATKRSVIDYDSVPEPGAVSP